MSNLAAYVLYSDRRLVTAELRSVFYYCKDNNNFCITQKILLNFCKVCIVLRRQSFRVSQNKVFDGFFNGIENVVLVPE